MKGSKNPNLGAQEDHSDSEYINDDSPSPVTGARGQPEPTHPTFGTYRPPTLGEYEGGTVRAPMAPASTTTGQPAHPLQTLGNRGTGSGPREPRTRAAVPPSDPHERVPRDHRFDQGVGQIGDGVGSGRNWLIHRDRDREPVLRAPLRIVRTKRDPIHQQNGSTYPGADVVIPAGTTLSQVCEKYPRHVWGEMLRIFISERWDARRIWELLPPNARNNAVNRPWNYIQAAMGREIDLMTQEETGVRRVPPKKKSPAPTAEEGRKALDQELNEVDDNDLARESIASDDNHPANDPYNRMDVKWANRLDVPQLIEMTRQYRELGVNAELARILVTYNAGGERDAERAWRRRHNAWARRFLGDFELRFGEPLESREPIEMIRQLFMRLNARMLGETHDNYNDRVNWNVWSHYAGVVQGLQDAAEADYRDLIRAELERDAAMTAEVRSGMVEEEDVNEDE
ncbi:hypothetical protein H2200_010204 [Cladophialophora chaetospira]|uniref:Uncharacterized protein n=1 Tax=Cladophialophora chaetospira TaxID=386627 RepID=A0AA38X2G5_9EURO|nr:hypothetical protein H2200_010204 [Cladophialophora chaetospira]